MCIYLEIKPTISLILLCFIKSWFSFDVNTSGIYKCLALFCCRGRFLFLHFQMFGWMEIRWYCYFVERVVLSVFVSVRVLISGNVADTVHGTSGLRARRTLQIVVKSQRVHYVFWGIVQCPLIRNHLPPLRESAKKWHMRCQSHVPHWCSGFNVR